MTEEMKIVKETLSNKLDEILEQYFNEETAKEPDEDFAFSVVPFVILCLYQFMVLDQGKPLADIYMKGIQEHEIKYNKEKLN